MIWLTPFDQIQLAMATPIDMTLDRIVLPVVAAIWLISLTAGPGRRAAVAASRSCTSRSASSSRARS